MLQPMKLFRAASFAALGGIAYAVAESRWFRIQEHRVPASAGVPPLRILHLADSHLRSKDRARLDFLASLPDRIGPLDLILMTGDMIENDSGIDPLLDLLARFDARYGKAYVLGSHDYYQSVFKFPFKYLGAIEPKIEAPLADTERMEKGLQEQGWICLTNRSARIEGPHGPILLTGVDDPYLGRHRTDHIARSDETLAIGVMHAPNLVSLYALKGFDLAVAGHTHGGQLRLPFFGALVTNSRLPTALAAGVAQIGGMALHVSPGLGVSEHMQIRFLCRPEVTILDLEPS